MISSDVLDFDIDGALENLPFRERVRDCSDFVYLFHTYSLMTGSNFLIWTRVLDGRCERYTFASGSLSLKVDYREYIVDDPALPRSQVIEKAVRAAVAAQESDPNENMLREASPHVDESRVISSDEFDHVVRLSAKFETGEQSMLGVDSAVRVITRTEDRASDVATWIGHGMADSDWGTINELLDFGGIRELPHRQFEVATGKFVES